jgi:hypothetical protein
MSTLAEKRGWYVNCEERLNGVITVSVTLTRNASICIVSFAVSSRFEEKLETATAV